MESMELSLGLPLFTEVGEDEEEELARGLCRGEAWSETEDGRDAASAFPFRKGLGGRG